MWEVENEEVKELVEKKEMEEREGVMYGSVRKDLSGEEELK